MEPEVWILLIVTFIIALAIYFILGPPHIFAPHSTPPQG